MDNRSSFGLPRSPFADGYGGVVSSLSGELPVNRMNSSYTVIDSGTITKFTSLPRGEIVELYCAGTPTFKNSATLICQGGVDYVASVGDLVVARSDGNSIWHLYVLVAAASYIPTESDFGGRLTTISAAPIPNSDTVGSQNIWLAPYNGKTTPTHTNGLWTRTQFTSGSSDQVGWVLNLGGNTNFPADSMQDFFATPSGLVARQWDAAMFWTESLITPATILASGGTAGYITTGTTGPSWTNPGTAFDGTTNKNGTSSALILQTTNTFAGANAICTFLGQDWGSGNSNVISKVIVTAPNDGSFCAGANSAYTFVVDGSNDGTNWHRISITRFDDTAAFGSVFTCPISVSEQLTYRFHRVGFDSNGSNNVRAAQIQFYKKVPPAAGRRLTLLDGFYVNDAIISSGTSPNMPGRTGPTSTTTIAQFEGVWRGTVHIDTSTAGQVTQHVLSGPNRVNGVYNAQNQIPIKLSAFSYASITTYVPVTSQRWNACESAVTGGGGINIQLVQGIVKEVIEVEIRRNVFLNCASAAASYEAGVGVDTALNFSGMEASCNIDSTGQAIGFEPTGYCSVPSIAGVRNFIAIERQGNNGAGTQAVSTGPRNSQLTVKWMG